MHPNPVQLAAMVADVLPQAVLVVSPRGQVLYRNIAADRFLPPGRDVSEVLRPASPEGRTALDSLWAAPPGRGDFTLARRIPISLAGHRSIIADVSMLHPENVVEEADDCLVVLVDDVTEQVSIERRLETAERLAGEGSTAAKIAHELNNPLDGVLRYVGLAMRSADKKGQEHLQAARDGLLRMAEVLGSYSRSATGRGGSPSEPAADLLRQAIDAMAPRAHKQNVRIRLQAEPGTDEVPVDGRLFQVACNLIKNGLDAMPEGGTLEVGLSAELGSLVLTFADEGWGIPASQQDDIFLPFFTTKEPGKGSGLGLAVCRDIVDKLGGRIDVESGAGQGSRFIVRVPATHDLEVLAGRNA
ncbi:MAG: two-component system sensor histidine kinase NtrB [Phycisphaerae bacterium]